MINIAKFIATRKELHLSQNELAAGICTQATLSKFENRGRVPSLKILTALCERLGLTLTDLIEDNSALAVPNEELLRQADFALVGYHYDKITQLLAQISKPDLIAEELWHFNYLQGVVALEADHNFVEALYYFNEILTDGKITPQNIYALLAQTGCGMVFELQSDLVKAERYYGQVLPLVLQYFPGNNQTASQLIRILLISGHFYQRICDYEISNQLLQYGYQLCSKQHLVYYLARLLYLLAQNAQAQHQDPGIIRQYLNDAAAFARLNHNEQLLAKISQFPLA